MAGPERLMEAFVQLWGIRKRDQEEERADHSPAGNAARPRGLMAQNISRHESDFGAAPKLRKRNLRRTFVEVR